MSDAAYTDTEAPEAEDLDFEEARVEAEADEAEEQSAEPAPKPQKDWERIAHDKTGQAAAERSRRRELERRLAALEAERQPRQQADPLNDLIANLREDDEDPIGDLSSVKAIAKAMLERDRREAEEQAKAQQQQQHFAKLSRDMAEAEEDFRSEHPDYDDAMKHFKTSLLGELEDEGFSGQELKREFESKLITLVDRALSNGRDPAQIVYNRAKKYGFASSEVDAATKKLQTIGKAQSAGRAPVNSGTKADLTLESVNKLQGAAFDKAFEALRKQQMRA